MQIGKLSERTGVSVRMLRYYEALGLLHSTRTASGYRVYASADIDLVRRIRVLNTAGIPLANVKSLLSCVGIKDVTHPPCEALRLKVHDQIQEVERQMSALKETHRLLSNLLRTGEQGEKAAG